MRRLLFAFLLLLMPALTYAQTPDYTCDCDDEVGMLSFPAPVDNQPFCATTDIECREYCEKLLNNESPNPKPDCQADVVVGAAPTESAPASRVVQLQDPLKLEKGIPELVGNIVATAVGVVGAIALLIFVYGGFLLLTSGGETAKIQAGKDAMKWSVIGLLVVFSSYTLVKFVLSTLSK